MTKKLTISTKDIMEIIAKQMTKQAEGYIYTAECDDCGIKWGTDDNEEPCHECGSTNCCYFENERS